MTSEKKKELDLESFFMHLQVCKKCQKLPDDKFCEIAWVCHGEALLAQGYEKGSRNIEF